MASLFDRGLREISVAAMVAALALAAQPAGATVSAGLIGTTVTARTTTSQYNAPSAPAFDYNSAQDALHGINVTALSDLTNNTILFRNGIAATGFGTSVITTTGVAITFTNNSTHTVRPMLDSTLLAAGVGVYLTSNSNTDPHGSGCAAGAITQCGSPSTTALGNLHDSQEFDLGPFGTNSSGFKFDVSVGGSSIYSLQGEVGEHYNAGAGKNVFYQNFNMGASGDASDILDDFALTTSPADTFAHTFAWGDTDVDIALPGLLNPGDSVTAIYTVQTYTTIGGDGSALYGTFDPSTGLTIAAPITYSSFGDPVGRGGTTNTQHNGLRFGPMSNAQTGNITGLDTTAVAHFTLGDEQYIQDADGNWILVGSLRAQTYVDPNVPLNISGSVPEPASWAMMLAGFGLAGLAMRRRRVAVA